MFSKVKCPNCGAKNSKERITCAECGTPLDLGQVERQLPQVSTEAEVPDKTVIEKEPKEIVEDEYRDNEKVLFKTRGQLVLPDKEPIEADCFVTEGHVVIEAKEPIKIPLLRIQECEIIIGFPYIFSHAKAATLTFINDLNKKQRLTLELPSKDFSYFKQALAEQVNSPVFRGQTTDALCLNLCAIGVDAWMAEQANPEQQIGRHGGGEITMLLGLGGDRSLGLIQIQGSPISWVSVLEGKESSLGGGFGGANQPTRCRNLYLVPDPTIRREAHLETIRQRSVPVFGRVVDSRWQGNFEDGFQGLTMDGALRPQSLAGLRETIRRLNEDVSLNQSLFGLREDIEIYSYPEYGYWAISSKRYQGGWFELRQPAPSREKWECYETIARHLLEPVESKEI